MSSNKLSMSLDEIIKANKSKAKTDNAAKNGAKKRKFTPRTKGGVLKRGGRIVKKKSQPQGNNGTRIQKKFNKPNGRNNSNNNNENRNQKLTTIATKKLVQKLVKKALTQRIARRPIVQQRKQGATTRYSKKAVVLTRLAPRSRVISRTPRAVVNSPIVRGRGVARYVQEQEFLPAVVRTRRNIGKKQPQRFQRQLVRQVMQPASSQILVRQRPIYVQQTRPAFVQQQPLKQQFVVQQQQFRPTFQQRNNRAMSIREQIAVLREQREPRVVYVRQQKQSNIRVQPMQNNRVRQFQPRRLQRNPNNRQKRPIKNEPFYEPPNFLQRF